ncbi:MAG: hypothetical protein R3F08_11020 [Dokdonella sp.]
MLVEEDGAQRLYFVVETKSSLFTDDLAGQGERQDRMRQGAFHALAVGENPARYVIARSIDDLLVEATGAAQRRLFSGLFEGYETATGECTQKQKYLVNQYLVESLLNCEVW